MQNPKRFLTYSVAAFASTLVAQAEPLSTQEAERLFALKVYPVMQTKCFACHGEKEDKIKGELNMMSREALLKGGERYTDVLVPGDHAKSKMWIAMTWEDPDMEMPPKENDRLNERQIEQVAQWIDAGAPWLDAAAREVYAIEERKVVENEDGVIVPHSGGQSDVWTYRRYEKDSIWAFQPLKDVAVPGDAGLNPIDSFLRKDQIAAGVEPAPQAKPEELVRRAYFDLTGLPPRPDAQEKFLAAWDQDPNTAWTNLVEELLASPQYGERWGQHWLDVVRYSDTGGMSNDYERSNAWRYRDYVISSLNEDKPYNQFIMEQIAGDELADASARERTGLEKLPADFSDYTDEEREQLVATGFLRMGPWDNAMIKADESRQIYLDDVVNNVGQSFLSTTMRCFKCHDHKFDPLPTKDYYRFYSAFAGTQMAERPVPFHEGENFSGYETEQAMVQRMLDYAIEKKEALEEKREAAARAWYEENNLPYKSLKDRADDEDDIKPPRMVGLNTQEQGELKVREQDEWIWTRRLERYEPMAQSVFNGDDTEWPQAKKLRIREMKDPNWVPPSVIYDGGSLEAPGEPVTPGVLSALGIPTDYEGGEDPYSLPEGLEGRRTVMAKWIAHPENPLSTRSIVNRIWLYHFGKPIAGTPNNFGVKGSAPTNPELLDWLAQEFVANNWSMKHLHRLIMNSSSYQVSSKHPNRDAVDKVDTNNDLFTYFTPRRLTAEEVRDTMLYVSGELNQTMGGLPAKPEINMEVALQPRMIQFSLAPAYQPSPTPEERNRRSIYSYRVRGQADPFLEIFNQPSPNESCDVRDSASVSPQVFTLLNSDVTTDRSIALADRIENEGGTITEKLDRAFELVLGRRATTSENERLANYVNEMIEYHKTSKVQPTEYPTQIVRTLVEEFSGEPFSYEEILPAFENYTPDKKAADVSPEVRALADVCVLLFNSNEFIYLY